jgi:alkanesulfonate monooxygenase SsuD/methylene tetrahydromethanopterin reductase-like flavin-dependent oxidoreductase (luciferase family)
VASAVATRTSRIRIGLSVQVLPLANPIRIAEEAAIVDHISKGRLDFGVGRSSFIDAYQGLNINYEESRSRFSESLEIIIKAWGMIPFPTKGSSTHSAT